MKRITLTIVALTCLTFGFTACKKDDDVKITVNAGGDDGDVTGQGGSSSETHKWTNNKSKAELDMDITATAVGSFNIVVEDAAGTEVLNQTLNSSSPDDSLEKCSSAGEAGEWTVKVTLTDFQGDGSFTLSQGCD